MFVVDQSRGPGRVQEDEAGAEQGACTRVQEDEQGACTLVSRGRDVEPPGGRLLMQPRAKGKRKEAMQDCKSDRATSWKETAASIRSKIGLIDVYVQD